MTRRERSVRRSRSHGRGGMGRPPGAGRGAALRKPRSRLRPGVVPGGAGRRSTPGSARMQHQVIEQWEHGSATISETKRHRHPQRRARRRGAVGDDLPHQRAPTDRRLPRLRATWRRSWPDQPRSRSDARAAALRALPRPVGTLASWPPDVPTGAEDRTLTLYDGHRTCASMFDDRRTKHATTGDRLMSTHRRHPDSPTAAPAAHAPRRDPVPVLPGPVHGHPRRVGGQRRAARDPPRPALLRGRPAVGGQRLHGHLRRLPAARRPRRRPARTPAGVRRRPAAVRARFAGRRHRRQPGAC